MTLLVLIRKLSQFARRTALAVSLVALGWTLALLMGLLGSKGGLRLKRPIVVDDPKLAASLTADGLTNVRLKEDTRGK